MEKMTNQKIHFSNNSIDIQNLINMYILKYNNLYLIFTLTIYIIVKVSSRP